MSDQPISAVEAERIGRGEATARGYDASGKVVRVDAASVWCVRFEPPANSDILGGGYVVMVSTDDGRILSSKVEQ